MAETTDDGGVARDPSALSLDDLVADALEADADERAQLLARLERQDARRARRVRSRLAALGDLGLSLDPQRRAAGPPQRFGAFVRIERVGAGGMGEVHLARHATSGDLAAIKLVRPEHQWFDAARGRFEREIEASAQLAHPGIVRVLEVGQEQGVPWLALEWVGGASLDDVLDRLRGMPPETLSATDFIDAVRAASSQRPHAEGAREGAFEGASYVEVVTRVAARIAEALAHAHDAGVLHRDVKPSNVLVTPAGRVVLADFGLALPRGADRMTRTGAWLGSLPYAAPEQIDGSPRALDGRADVYSLAATLYELLTLRTPFLGGPETTVRHRISTGDLEPPRRLNPAIPASIERVCAAALDLDRRRRPPHARALCDDLRRALAGLPVRSARAPALVRARRYVRRRPTLSASIAAVVLVVAASLAFAVRERALSTRLTRLADAELVRGLIADARDFWPATPERVAAIEGWIERSQALAARRAEHRSSLDELSKHALRYDDDDRARDQAATRERLAMLLDEIDGLAAFVERGNRIEPPPPPLPDAVRARESENGALLRSDAGVLLAALHARVAAVRAAMEVDAARWRPDLAQIDDFDRLLDRAELELGRRTTFRFADPLDAWLHDSLRRLLADLDRLDELLPSVRAQLATTRELADLAADAGAKAWDVARAAVRADPRFNGLSPSPVFGWLPLGADPTSGLQEFLLVESGAAPVRDAAGVQRIHEATGLVLVLVPGGRFRMGRRDGEGPTNTGNLPAHEVELAPFFVSKYELTVAQAQRLGGFPAEKTRPADGRLPLSIDWERARETLLRHGLELPTEAQWEYAARADAETPASLDGYANVSDRSRADALRVEGSHWLGPFADFEDGFANAAPVGSYRPNAFGLYDTLGNVAEWCLDCFIARGYATLVPRPRDGLRATVVGAQLRSVRGGSFVQVPELCQPSLRWSDAPGKLMYSIGVRPVRSL